MAKSYLARGNEESSERYFREASKFFHECKRSLREAACYEALGEFEKAGGMWVTCQCLLALLTQDIDIFAANEEFSRAADMYTLADMFEEAAKNFVLAGRYNDGASGLAKGKCFDALVSYLNKYGIQLSMFF